MIHKFEKAKESDPLYAKPEFLKRLQIAQPTEIYLVQQPNLLSAPHDVQYFYVFERVCKFGYAKAVHTLVKFFAVPGMAGCQCRGILSRTQRKVSRCSVLDKHELPYCKNTHEQSYSCDLNNQ